VIYIFLIRGLMSPFAHVMFTACVGIFLGIAASRTGPAGGIGLFFVGLIPAILLHALWNGSLFFVQDFFGYYAIVQVPLFIFAVLLVVYLRKQESKIALKHLTAYAAAGWFHPNEISALATGPGRRVAMGWARRHGIHPVMKKYIRNSTRLAFTRQRMTTGYNVPRAQADEAILLDSIVENRRSLGSTTAQ